MKLWTGNFSQLCLAASSSKIPHNCLHTKSAATVSENLVRTAITPRSPTNLRSLVKSLIDGAVLHQPGSCVILNKPFGLSCLGYKQKEGGIFRNSRHDWAERNTDEDESDQRARSDDVFLADAIPFIAEYFGEPNLRFCTGLKRYISGPVLLPANDSIFKTIRSSLRHFDIKSPDEGFRHKAFTICAGTPIEKVGYITGYATFQSVRDHKEYIFVRDGKVKKRAIAGKFAVMGSMSYRVLASKYGCSLIDISFAKFNRHLPRLMLTQLLSPVLGDPLYMQRVVTIDGASKLIAPKDVYRTKNMANDLTVLSKRLSVPQTDLFSKLPFFFHVYQTVFPYIRSQSESQEHMELVASSPLPEHMVAMLKCLEMLDTAVSHLNTVDQERERF